MACPPPRFNRHEPDPPPLKTILLLSDQQFAAIVTLICLLAPGTRDPFARRPPARPSPSAFLPAARRHATVAAIMMP
jgi:hypothetical protein